MITKTASPPNNATKLSGEYTTLAALPQALGVDVLARLHPCRKADFRKGQRLAKHDGLFVWQKGGQPSHILSATEWGLLPAQITVRFIRFTATIRGFRSRRVTLVTSLLDPKLYPAEPLMALYARRWRLELCLRDLKTTLGMEQLRCQSPAMVEKELLAFLIAHSEAQFGALKGQVRFEPRLARLQEIGSTIRPSLHRISSIPKGSLT